VFAGKREGFGRRRGKNENEEKIRHHSCEN